VGVVGGAIALLVLVGDVKTTWSFSAFNVLIHSDKSTGIGVAAAIIISGSTPRAMAISNFFLPGLNPRLLI